MGRVNRACLGGFAADLVALNQGKHLIRSITKALYEARSISVPKGRAHFGGRVPDTGVDQTDTATGTAKAKLVGFKNMRRKAMFRTVQRCGEPRETAANNRNISCGIAVEWRCEILFRRGSIP